MANPIDRLPAQVVLVFSRALSSLGTPIVALLIATAGGVEMDEEDAISFCNVLFVGNLCAAGVTLTSFGPRRILLPMRGLGARSWAEILLFGALSALLSALIFTALQTTTVTNAVLLARLGPVLFVLGSAMLLGESIHRAEWMGFSLIALGVVAAVFTSGGFDVRTGDLLIMASATVFALVTAMSKRLLDVTGLPGLVFARNLFSAVVFFWIAVGLYGFGHFADAFSGPLWGIMVVYAMLVIVLSQLSWYYALKRLPPAAVTRWTVITPALAVAYAFVINGERPGVAQISALGFVTAGILVSNLGKLTPPGTADSAESSVSAS